MEMLERIREHPFVTALLLSVLLKLFFRAFIFFSPLIISTMLCVLALLRLGPHLEECKNELGSLAASSSSREASPHAERRAMNAADKELWLRKEAVTMVRELYTLAMENAQDSKVVREVSCSFERLMECVHEFGSCVRELLAESSISSSSSSSSFLQLNKRSLVNKACRVSGMLLGADVAARPIRAIGTFIDEAVSEEPIDYTKEEELREQHGSISSSIFQGGADVDTDVSSEADVEADAGDTEDGPSDVDGDVAGGDVFHAAADSSAVDSDSDADPYIRLFADGSECTDMDVEECTEPLPPAFRPRPTSPLRQETSPLRQETSPLRQGRQRAVMAKRKHFLSDLFFLPSLLRASRRCFIACFRHRLPRPSLTTGRNYQSD